MRIDYIEFKNFASYGNQKQRIDFLKEGSELFLTLGKNGDGKTTIANAIIYALYGKVEGVKLADLPNRINKELHVKIGLQCGTMFIEIERGISPNKFSVLINGVEFDKAGKKSVQEYLEDEVFGIPYHVFKNIIILSVNDFKSFLTMSNQDKKQIIDRMFGFSILNDMQRQIKDERRDIKFDIDNIHIGGTVSTYIKFGKSFGIDVVSSSSDYANLSYSTQITGAAAQGGNSPVAFVNDLMREMGSNITFLNTNAEYPRTNEEFLYPKSNTKIKYTDKHYEKWFNFLKRYFKVQDSNTKNYDSFSKYISMLYRKGKVSGGAPAAQTKLMQLHFYYDTLSNFSKNKDFWLRVLYLGMKVGKIFAPHAKIY